MFNFCKTRVVIAEIAPKRSIWRKKFTDTNLLVILLSILFSSEIKPAGTVDFDYCKISNEHTMCVYKTISKNCIQYRTQNEITVHRMINDHNLARSKFAGGRKGYFIPNMMKMYWDQELADLSARWACQCKGTLDDDRGVRRPAWSLVPRIVVPRHQKLWLSMLPNYSDFVSFTLTFKDHKVHKGNSTSTGRFEVGQVVWTVMRPHNFTEWNEIWKFMISGGTGFYQRDNWGRMITNYDPSDPLSLIYNPYVRFLGCTLAKYLIWSVDFSSFAYTTTLVCNYGPVGDSYEKYAKEDWPCRECPKANPCSTQFYMRGNVLPPNLANERNLCIDPKFENQNPQPGKRCPVEHLEIPRLLMGARRIDDVEIMKTTTMKQNNVEPKRTGKAKKKLGYDYEGIEEEKETTMPHPPWAVNVSTTPAWPSYDDYPIQDTSEIPNESKTAEISKPIESTTLMNTTDYEDDYDDETTDDIVNTSSIAIISTTNATVNTSTSKDPPIDHGEHDPSEEGYDYHGPVDGDGYINYCEVFCSPNTTHTLCQYKKTSPNCTQFVNLGNPMTLDDLLHLHNKFRNNFAEGKLGPPHPLSSNMVRLRWSNELENTAEMWLRQCQLKHDYCRDTPLSNPADGNQLRAFSVSQNIGWMEYGMDEAYPSHRDLFQMWVDQGKNFTYTTVSDYLSYEEKGGPKVDDFVQVIWARTHYIGCAYGSFAKDASRTRGIAMLICNYAPLGKEVNKQIYIPGGPCANCYTETDFGKGHCVMQDYPNLCDAGILLQPSTAIFILTNYLLSRNLLHQIVL